MPISGQPAATSTLQEAMDLLAQGNTDNAEELVTKAAKRAKAQFGSGSHPLANAYADMARFHYYQGNFKRAALEFRHAGESPMPSETNERADRLAIMFGYAACLEELDKTLEAEKVYRQCVEFARALHGPDTPSYAMAIPPLAELLLKTGPNSEAVRLSDEAFTVLWKHGHSAISSVAALRGEAMRAAGRSDDPYADLADLPEELAIETVSEGLKRSSRCGGIRARQMLVDLLRFADRRFDLDHPSIAEILAAVVHHEATLRDQCDAKLRSTAARRFVWSFTHRRAPESILDSIEVGFEPDGTIHLVPHVAREPDANEFVLLEMVLTQAVDDLYARSQKTS